MSRNCLNIKESEVNKMKKAIIKQCKQCGHIFEPEHNSTVICSACEKSLEMLTEKQKDFNKIGETIVSVMPGVEAIYIDAFNVKERYYNYLVVRFKGGAISVRNCVANSLTANIREVSKMLDGGYYVEVEDYLKLRNRAFWE